MMSHRRTIAAGVAVAGLTSAGLLLAGVIPSAAANSIGRSPDARHVLVISIDGMHQSDLAGYVAAHPTSALATLVDTGADFADARTTFPSDSFPGMVAQFTGATPGQSGVYYDDTYNRRLLPAGTKHCTTATPGTEVPWTEGIDRSQDPITLDAGQGLQAPALTALPSNTLQQTLDSSAAITRAILAMTPQPRTVIDRAALPVDPSTCRPVYPHDYLRVNTVFDVARAAGLRTAWSDKHPAYEILDGRNGKGVEDLFTPEINSVADAAGDDWSTDNDLTEEYDGFKVAAVLNEIDGLDHSGARRVGTPAVFGMNFQTLSTAQKLPESDGLTGGYHPDGTPGPLVTRALGYVDAQVGRMLTRIRRDHLADSTTIILSAKHGQSPIDPTQLRRVDDGPILDGLDAGWAALHPSAAPLVAFSVDDDVMLLWLSDRSAAADRFATHYLLTHRAPANTISDPTGTFSTSVASSGLRSVHTGLAADRLVGARPNDAHAPDLIGITQVGVVYTGKTSKIAEHGGDAPADRHVPLVVSGAGARHMTSEQAVQTTQIAPTILALLGLPADRLQAVRDGDVRALPGLRP